MVIPNPKIVTVEGTEHPIQAVQPGTSQKVALGAASAQSAAIAAFLVRVVSQGDCHLAFGANPTAVADGTCAFLPAGIPEYFVVTSGNKIAVIQDTAQAVGNLFITAAV
jgi:hypothetical protein